MGKINKVLMEVAMEDFEFFAEHFLKIKPKEGGGVVPFKFNQAQQYAHEQIEAQREKIGKVRCLLLKGRQQGMSTYSEGRFYWNVWRTMGMNAFILTHEDDATKNLFAMVERFHENMPKDYKWRTGKSNEKELWFDKKDAGYKVGTARTKGTGRSQTVHFLHWSEVSHSANQKEHLAGLDEAVPETDGTEKIYETTANGVGDEFYRLWFAKDPGEWIRVFIPWYWQDEYRTEPPPGFTKTEKEQALADKYDLDDAQVYWYRLKVQKSGEDLTRQEYPFTAQEAFLASGAMFFPVEALSRIEDEIMDPIARGVLEQDGEQVRFIAQSNGWLEIFEWPDEKEDYVIGEDISEGLPHGDLTSGHVLLRAPIARQVARFAPQVAPDDAGRYAVRVARYYNGRVPVGIERNSMGVAAVIAAQDTAYPHLFRMDTGEATINQKPGERFGWQTTQTSRPVLCGDLLGAVRDGSIIIRSEETLSQMRTFIRGPTGKPVAAVNCWDDDVIGLGIAYQMLQRTEKIVNLPVINLNPEATHGGWAG